MTLHEELRELVESYGPGLLLDPEQFRAALDDYVDEGTAFPGQLNLLHDAVRFGALARCLELLDRGGDQAAVIQQAGDGLARERGSLEVASARWAVATLAHAMGRIDRSTLDLFVGTPTTEVPPLAPTVIPTAGPPPSSPPPSSPPSSAPPSMPPPPAPPPSAPPPSLPPPSLPTPSAPPPSAPPPSEPPPSVPTPSVPAPTSVPPTSVPAPTSVPPTSVPATPEAPPEPVAPAPAPDHQHAPEPPPPAPVATPEAPGTALAPPFQPPVQPPVQPPPSAGSGPPPGGSRKPVLVAVGAVVLVALLGTGAWAVISRSDDPEATAKDDPSSTPSDSASSPSGPETTETTTSEPPALEAPDRPRLTADPGYRSVVFTLGGSVVEEDDITLEALVDGEWTTTKASFRLPTDKGGQQVCARARAVRVDGDERAVGPVSQVCGKSQPPTVKLLPSDIPCDTAAGPSCHTFVLSVTGLEAKAPYTMRILGALQPSGTFDECSGDCTKTFRTDGQGRAKVKKAAGGFDGQEIRVEVEGITAKIRVG